MKTRIAIALPDDLFNAIVKMAAQQRVTISEYLGQAVIEHLKITGVAITIGRLAVGGSAKKLSAKAWQGLTIVDPFAHSPEQILASR